MAMCVFVVDDGDVVQSPNGNAEEKAGKGPAPVDAVPCVSVWVKVGVNWSFRRCNSNCCFGR